MSNDQRRRRRTWREVDAGKSRGPRRHSQPGSDPSRRHGSRAYKAELDQFFDHGVASSRIKSLVKSSGADLQKAEPHNPERVALLRKIRGATTFDEFVDTTTVLHQDHGLPSEVDILTRCLEHPDPVIVNDALIGLTKLNHPMKIGDLKALNSRLDSLATFNDTPETQQLIEAVRAKY